MPREKNSPSDLTLRLNVVGILKKSMVKSTFLNEFYLKTMDFHSNKLQRNLFIRSSNSLESDGKYKELTMKGLEDLFFTSGNSLEAISLERESTVPILRGSESQCILPIVRPKRVSGAAMTTDSETQA